MTDAVPRWQQVVPGSLPTHTLNVVFRDDTLLATVASFDFAGFLAMHTLAPQHAWSRVRDGLYYLSPSAAASVLTGKNHYGPAFSIEISANTIVLEEYWYSGDCQTTSMRLLSYLIVDLRRPCHWHAYSWYEDNYERSEVRQGTEAELRAVLTGSTP